MAAVARYLDHPLVRRITAMIAAVFVVAADPAAASFMFTSVVVVSH